MVWDHLRAKYYNDWLSADPENWTVIRTKLDMVSDLRDLLRKFDNA